MVKCEIRKICEYCAYPVRVMDPDMKSDTENNICGLNCINVPPNKMKKNIQLYFSTWLDYIDKPVMVLCKYLNNPVFLFSTSPRPLCEGVNPAVGSHNTKLILIGPLPVFFSFNYYHNSLLHVSITVCYGKNRQLNKGNRNLGFGLLVSEVLPPHPSLHYNAISIIHYLLHWHWVLTLDFICMLQNRPYACIIPRKLGWLCSIVPHYNIFILKTAPCPSFLDYVPSVLIEWCPYLWYTLYYCNINAWSCFQRS